MQNIYKKAFSLIEISVVIAIMGILIAGISQGIDLYKDTKLATARSLTLNSRVGRVDDLVAWYETTSIKSINFAEAFDGKEISTWFDIKPNTTSPKNATQNLQSRKPKYNYKNSLPLINFNGITNGQFFNLPNGTVPYGDSSYTIFLVLQLASDANNTHNDVLVTGKWIKPITLMRLRKSSSNFFTFNIFSGENNNLTSKIHEAETSNLSTNKLLILTAKYQNSPTRNVTAYVNSIQNVSLNITNARTTMDDYNMIGGNSWANFEFFRGDIGEIIIYDRTLLDSERKSIEEYLSKKWSIKIN
jgi:prepilin-type N-terminal cleavage/methylation domain-containing protein